MKITISDYFELTESQDKLVFFNADLTTDTPLYIDPMLIKYSSNPEVRELYWRFALFFQKISEKLISVRLNIYDDELRSLVYFKESSFIHLWYTKKWSKWKGPWATFGDSLLRFLGWHMARKVLDRELKKWDFNPGLLRIFVDWLWPDWIWDLSAGIIMDYLISFTQKQCEIYHIPLKQLWVTGYFDNQEFEWCSRYFDLPENPNEKWQPIIFVPKDILKYMWDWLEEKVIKNVTYFINSDDLLKSKFASVVEKSLDSIWIETIREILYEDETIMNELIAQIESWESKSYDFIDDYLEFASVEKHRKYIEWLNIDVTSCNTPDELLEIVMTFIWIIEKEYQEKDWWRNAWNWANPCREVTFGRYIRAMWNSYFHFYKDITFISEMWSWHGFIDFTVIYKSFRVAIEIKNLSNWSKTWDRKIPAYIHGMAIQLPKYISLINATYGIYITLQHYDKDDEKIKELKSMSWDIEKEIKKTMKEFIWLYYINIDLKSKPSPSKI